MNLLSSGTLGRIEAGGSRSVALYFNPQIGQPVNGYLAKLVIRSSNAPRKEVDVWVAITQRGVGDALVHVGDIYSTAYNGLAGATVLLESEFTDPNTLAGAVMVSGSTDATGQAFFQALPAGWYQVRVSADRHNSTNARLCVAPQPAGGAAYLDVNLPYSVVSLSWSVVPVDLQDEYNIVLNATYETKVPAPVVVMDPPSFNLPDLSPGDRFTGQITLTNLGLLSANQVTFIQPADDVYFKFELLNPVPSTLEAGQRVVVSYRVTCLSPLGTGPAAVADLFGDWGWLKNVAPSAWEKMERRAGGGLYRPVQNRSGSGGCWSDSNCFTERHWVGCLWNPALGYWATNYVCTAKSGGICPGTPGPASGASQSGTSSIWQFLGTPVAGGPSVVPPGQSLPTIVGQKCFPPPADCQSAPSPLRKSDCDDPPKGPSCEGPANWDAKSSWVNLPSREYRDEVVDLALAVPGGKIDISRYYTSKSGRWKWNCLDFNLAITAQGDDTVCGILRGQTRFTPLQPCSQAGTAAQGDRPAVFYNDWLLKSEKIVAGYDSANGRFSKLRWSDHGGRWCDYDRTGRLIDAGMRDLALAHYQYDDRGRLQTISSGGGGIVLATFVYTGTADRPAQVSDRMGRLVSYGYDSAGMLASVGIGGDIIPDVQVSSQDIRNDVSTNVGNDVSTCTYSYDAQGRMTGKTTENGTFPIGYDAAGYLHSIADAGGGTTLYDFDYDQQVYYARVLDADGKGTERYFDAMGRLTQEKVDGAVTQTVSYNGLNQTLKDAQGRITSQWYDENSNLIRETLPDGATTVSSYDPVNSQLLRRQDPLGKVTMYHYDGDGNLSSMTEGDGTPLARTTTWSGYDHHRPTHEVDPAGMVTESRYLPDDRGGETIQITVTGTDQRIETRSRESDLAGNLTASTDPLGQRTQWAWDTAGRLLSETRAGLSTLNTYEHGTGDLVEVETGHSDGCTGRILRYGYDAMHRRIATIALDEQGVQVVQQRRAYNAAGRVVTETDALGNVTSYGYDSHGNSIWVKQNGETVVAQVYDAADHLVEVDSPTGAFGTLSARMTYDFAGRVLTRTSGTGGEERTVTHVYQPGGLLSATIHTGSGGTFTTRYEYDVFGRRTTVSGDLEPPSITHYNAAGLVDSVTDGNGNSTVYGYDGFGRPATQTSGSETRATVYLRGQSVHCCRNGFDGRGGTWEDRWIWRGMFGFNMQERFTM